MDSVYFAWNNDFETGNELVDQQHYSLVDLINTLIKIDLENNTEAATKLLSISEQLTTYIVEHFKTEEALMNEYAIDERHVKMHKMSHQSFEDKISHKCNYMECLMNENNMKEVIEYLINWLAYHILSIDKSLFRQIESIKEEKLTPQKAYEKEEQMIYSTTEPLLKALKALYYLAAEKNKKLEEKNLELEAIVSERTKELKTANETLRQMSILDELTGLYNRRFALTEIEQLLDNWKKYQIPFSILYLDADKFKNVNDTYGHEKGDLVLKWIAKFLKNNVKNTDIICRLGGDEFIVICIHCEQEGVMETEQSLRDACTMNACQELGSYWKPSLSTGMATVDKTIVLAEEILKKADEAMYLSKKNGGGQITIR